MMGIIEIIWFIIKAGIALFVIISAWFIFVSVIETLGSPRIKKFSK